jgi:hypothetical protein
MHAKPKNSFFSLYYGDLEPNPQYLQVVSGYTYCLHLQTWRRRDRRENHRWRISGLVWEGSYIAATAWRCVPVPWQSALCLDALRHCTCATAEVSDKLTDPPLNNNFLLLDGLGRLVCSHSELFCRVDRTPWTSDRPGGRSLPTQENTKHGKSQMYICACTRIRTHHASARESKDLSCQRPLCHFDQLKY